MRKLLTIKQLSEMLSVPIRTIYGWTYMQFIPHYKIGRLLRFDEDEINRWPKRCYIKGQYIMKLNINSF